MLPLLGIIAPIVGKLFGKAADVIDQVVEDKDLANKIKAQLQVQAAQIDHNEFTTHLKEAASIIRTEADSQSFLARNWRPGLMALFGLIVFNNYVFYPYLSLFFPEAPMLEVPPDMWGLLKLGVGGYVVGRSGEKIVKVIKNK